MRLRPLLLTIALLGAVATLAGCGTGDDAHYADEQLVARIAQLEADLDEARASVADAQEAADAATADRIASLEADLREARAASLPEVKGWACTSPEHAALFSDILLFTVMTASELAAANAWLMEIMKTAPVMPDLAAEWTAGMSTPVSYVVGISREDPSLSDRSLAKEPDIHLWAAAALPTFGTRDAFELFKDVVPFSEPLSMPSAAADRMWEVADQYAAFVDVLIAECNAPAPSD